MKIPGLGRYSVYSLVSTEAMTGFAHTEIKEVNKCHFLTTKGP